MSCLIDNMIGSCIVSPVNVLPDVPLELAMTGFQVRPVFSMILCI